MQSRIPRLRALMARAGVLSLLALTLPAIAGTSMAGQAHAAAPRPAHPHELEPEHVARSARPMPDRPPLPSSKDELRRDYDEPAVTMSPTHRAAATACDVADFTGRTGQALVTQIESSSPQCVNSLFSLTGTDAYYAFREAQMTTVAYGLRDNAYYYDGTNNAGTAQLVLYLRAGYYVQYYNGSDVGDYGPALKTAIRSALDTFFGNSHSSDVSDANGETLAEAVTLIDSASENARYLYVVERMLNGYNSSYNGSHRMLAAVNNVYFALFRGHWLPEFVTTVEADQGILDTLYRFASSHVDLLGTDQSYLTSNAGRELGRFLQHAGLRGAVRPLLRGLLNQSSIRGATAPLWVGIAEMTDYYDAANCAYYDTCDLRERLAAEVLPINHTCASTLRIRAQQMTASELAWACGSMLSQDAYFHDLVGDTGPVAGDLNTDLEIVVFDSSTDYQTYAGAMFGIDTNNGGMYLEGDPADPANQARFIAYEAEWQRPTFEIWNLNHEYTHYLDGRYNMHGDFGDNITTPTIWWIEGFAEYVSYSYRNLTYTAAIDEAANRTYALSTLFTTTYSHDTTRIYRWGYLAVRYMMQSHRTDVSTMLGYYRDGSYDTAYSFLTGSIGGRYDSDWYSWLSRCAAGECGGGGNRPPNASFTFTVSDLTVSFTDRSTDADGSIVSRSWTFGDGSGSTAANPTKTYISGGTYTVTLTVTDDQGVTDTVSQAVTVSSGGGTEPECTGGDDRALGRNCSRGNRSTSSGNYDYLYLYLPGDVTSLRITATGGTGDCDLYYNPYSWATASDYTHVSASPGNDESLTITGPPSGYNYISLYGRDGGCAGVTVTTRY